MSLLVKETNATIRLIPIDADQRMAKRLLWLTAFAFGLGVALPSFAQSPGNFSSLSATGAATLNGDVLMCSGRPWIDVRCNGAIGDGNHDDTTAINTTIGTAITNSWPVHFSGGTYKVSSPISIDYAGQASHGFRLISEAATIDGRSIASGPVLQIQCGRGTPTSPTGCFYFKEEGTLFVNANTPDYAVVFGNANFSDAHNSAKIDHLIVNNASAAPRAGGCQFNFVLDSDIYAVCVAAGGAAGLAFEQTQFSRISGAGTAEGTGGRSVVLENGYNFSNTFFALDLEVSPTCLSITFDHNGLNTFVSPFFNCITAVNATASNGNLLLNPNYGGATVNFGPSSTGITVIGSGSRSPWYFPSVGSYTAVAIDDGINISSYNAPGASMTVTLPALASLNPGWTMGFATDNGKGMTVVAPSGAILAGGRSLASVTLGAGNYEYFQVQADGNNFRVVSATRNTRLINGFDPPPWPSNWLYPSTPGYAATLGDNGNILSSSNTASGLAVTLPATTMLPTGWSMGFATDGTKPLSIQVNATSGGHMLWPGSGSSATRLALANTSQGAYEFLVLQYDGGGNFHVVDMTPATAQAIGTIGAGGITHWSFPSVSAYAATVADNGGVVSSYNSPLPYLALTLPPTTAIPMGWTIGIATDNGKIAAVQVNGTSGGHILYPAGATGTSSTSVTLAAINYEFLALQFDGSNFRIVSITPRSAAALGMLGHQIMTGANPTVGAGSGDCGTAPSIGGNDGAGRVTVGSATNGGKCTITFVSPWPNPPICSAFDETTGNLIRPAATSTTSVALTGTLTAGDSLVYQCVGYQ